MSLLANPMHAAARPVGAQSPSFRTNRGRPDGFPTAQIHLRLPVAAVPRQTKRRGFPADDPLTNDQLGGGLSVGREFEHRRFRSTPFVCVIPCLPSIVNVGSRRRGLRNLPPCLV